MRILPKLLVALAVFIAAIAVVLILSDDPSKDQEDKRRSAVQNRIWSVGDRWTVTVRQDAGNITPDGATSIAKVPYRFHVTKAPADADGSWVVHVTLDGAEGPFAKGWYLQYRERDDVMRLERVAVGDEEPMEAELASIVLGPSIPYETSYSKRPRSHSVDGAKLASRISLPPSELPNAPGAPRTDTPPPAS